LHLADEAEAAARHRSDEPLLLSGVADCAPSGADPAGEGIVRHRAAIPDRLQQLVLADDTVPMLDQISQNLEHLRLDMDGRAVPAQLELVSIDLAVAKIHDHCVPSMLG
jgi:hypothetical protein